ncbi:dynamin-related GTPase DNM1 KNAG_0H02320 [Huiozyma naganishii CBS 8797]|uniref:Dynamin-related protein DNM1 n=1 Tax=Huiozyma naganishii (strain ATCC MYA-139 / BCRC 22969 / CBS 8797 / KCTC 17520 / NBRC 10181 / NCYC 3082 / Yp74L-3) TaxID=1071383 RepID=J7S9Q6_HUIN7|nr:hypothetical protein KNAG_0H02320 [Kazachstania naganishii CBS 8797]CCK71646.1 hypothetical protein KNAG_0H02320 [Kazachstania naganishii CBS 8797]
MASLEDLIPTVNKLQDVMYSSGIDSLDLPVLAVVGSQSSGKSSILETLVGRDFLPRGTGIVTRRPLVLQLNTIAPPRSTNDEEDSDNDDVDGPHSEWGEFLHKPGEKFYDFDEIRREIENETFRIAGKNKGISKIPINLKIFSPHVLNLTLVDLPGITKVPIGEQPHDIERQIKNLILDYVATPNCLILAVSPANVDLVNSESLKLAKEVDPQGKRTIGVITKLDLMDSGTNALDILQGKVYPLELGFVGVVNRSQQDIQLNVSVNDALDNEEHYFVRHPAYRAIANKCGTRYLAKLLNKTLMAHIRDKLPDIKTKLNNLITRTEKELQKYGDIGTITSQASKAGLILQLINIFAKNFTASIDGNSLNINTKELCGGARIYYIYNSIFGKTLEAIDPTSNLTTSDIKTAIRNSTGPRATLFVPELAFDLLVKPQITMLLEPSQHCVELVFEELMKICHNSSNAELARYPNLKKTLVDVVSNLLRERLTPTHNYVESLIDIHKAYINTNHPKFLSATEVMTDILNERESKKKMFHIQSQRKLSPIGDDQPPQQANTIDTLTTEEVNSTSSNSIRGDNLDRENKDELISNFSNTNNNYAHKMGNAGNTDKDTFLNYFFGKDKEAGKAGRENDRSNNANGKANSYAEIQNGSIFSNLRLNEYPEHDVSTFTEGESTLTEREQLECELIRRLIISYFDIVREMIEDQIPKAIMCLLVNHCKESIHNRLVAELYKEAMLDELLQEDETLAQERANCEQLLETYKKASMLVNNTL